MITRYSLLDNDENVMVDDNGIFVTYNDYINIIKKLQVVLIEAVAYRTALCKNSDPFDEDGDPMDWDSTLKRWKLVLDSLHDQKSTERKSIGVTLVQASSLR